MRTIILGAAALLMSWANAEAQLSVTVYNNNLVLVQDIRTLDVPKGRSRIEFPDVSAAIRPETVSLTGPGLSVVEQNFDYDLLTPAKMMEKQVGRQLQLVRTNPATGKETVETATVLSVNAGVVLKIGNRIEALRDDGLPTRVVFSAIPPNLRAQPTLSVIVDADRAGPRKINLSYLSSGLSWSSNYVGMYDEKQGTMNLQGWITISNHSGTGFANADAELIAGAINTTTGRQSYGGSGATVDAGRGAQKNLEQLADFYAYRLPERVTIANEQTKQIAFLDLGSAHAAKSYEFQTFDFYSAQQAQHADVILRFSNGSDALPDGTVRVYMRDSRGDPKFMGESGLAHTPAGSNVGIQLGQAFDVTVQPTLVSSEKFGKDGMRYAMSYTLRNASSVPVKVDLSQRGLQLDGRVVDESIKSERKNASTVVWTVPVAANGETVVTATLETGGK